MSETSSVRYLKDSAFIVFPNGKFTVCAKTDAGHLSGKSSSRIPNFEIGVFGRDSMFLSENGFKFKGLKEEENFTELYYECVTWHLQVTVLLEFIAGTDVVIQKNTIKNIGDDTVKVTKFSSAFLDNVCFSENSPYYSNGSVKVNICHSKWQGEGQWKKYSLPEIGIYPTSIHDWEKEIYTITSVGSWSTGSYYPLIVVEDEDKHRSWFMETEGSHSWSMCIKASGGYDFPNLSIGASGCDEANGGWYYDLKPGEEYSSERAFFGMTDGGFEGAVSDLIAFKRKDSTVRFDGGIMPIVFNDFMDCVWSNQDPKLIIPLVDSAAKAGCEVFCIDGGWCENKGGKGNGDWLPKKEYYDMQGLKKLADYIRSKNMIPGIWLELESCHETAYGYRIDEDCILKRYGLEVGGYNRFYNFSNPKVREYLTGRIRALYDIGFRYIKNDYNASIGIGATNNYEGDSSAEGAIVSANSFYDFVDGLYDEFPDLVIENCGSGALRCDNKMLRRCSLQSTSDQEIYYNNPSIVMGSMAVMPPEKAGIWAYPYPAVYPYSNGKYIPFEPNGEYRDRMKDGKETVFNMVTAMTGYLYLSGRIDCCDEENFELVKESIEFYKGIRKYITVSRPIFPTGMIGINEKKTASFGLISKNRLLLAVWNITDEKTSVCVPLSGYIKSEISVNAVYPSKSRYNISDGAVYVELDSLEAAYFEIIF